MELYLKGYLLASGWQQEKTKNLSKLLQSAAQFDPRLGAFLDSLKELNRDFRLTQYPGGDLRNVSEHFALHRQKADEMISLIRQNLPHFFSKPATK